MQARMLHRMDLANETQSTICFCCGND